MFTEPLIFLLILIIIGLFAKNQSLIIAVSVLLIVKIVGFDGRFFPLIQAKGINWGVTLITIQ